MEKLALIENSLSSLPINLRWTPNSGKQCVNSVIAGKQCVNSIIVVLVSKSFYMTLFRIFTTILSVWYFVVFALKLYYKSVDQVIASHVCKAVQ